MLDIISIEIINLKYIDIENILADILIKKLDGTKILKFTNNILI
jgi:hypothetical protein